MICTNCNTTQNNGTQFCSTCGAQMMQPQMQNNSMPPPQASPNQMPPSQGYPNQMPPPQGYPNPMPQYQGYPNPMPQYQGFRTSDRINSIMHLVGSNPGYYAAAFTKIENGQKSFNWCAFLFNLTFFSYHKMYKPTLVYWLIPAAISIVNMLLFFLFLFIDPTVGVFIGAATTIITLVLMLIINIRGGSNFDRLLYEHLLEVTSKRGMMNELEYYSFEQKNAGVSAMNIVLMIIPYVSSVFMIVLLVKAFIQNSKLNYRII